MRGIRVMRSHWFIVVTAAMVALLAAGMVIIATAARSNLADFDLDVPSYYRPGQVLQPGLPCSDYIYPEYSTAAGDCLQTKDGNLEYTVEFTVPDLMIQLTSKWTLDTPLTLGDLINRWGSPRGRIGSFVAWDHRYACVFDLPDFSPKSKVYFISYGTVPGMLQPWRGFASNPSAITTIPLPGLAATEPAYP